MSQDDKLQQYVALLLKWNKKINLIAKSTEEEIWNRHIEDSLQLAKFFENNNLTNVSRETSPDNSNKNNGLSIKTGKTIVDFGSGGGLPAIPLAISTNLPVVMVESDQRKAIFLKECLRELGLQGEVINERVERAKLSFAPEQAILTARALASVNKLFELINSFLANNEVASYKILLLKGKNLQEEIAEAEQNWLWNGDIFPDNLSEDAQILQVNGFKKA